TSAIIITGHMFGEYQHWALRLSSGNRWKNSRNPRGMSKERKSTAPQSFPPMTKPWLPNTRTSVSGETDKTFRFPRQEAGPKAHTKSIASVNHQVGVPVEPAHLAVPPRLSC